MLHLSHAPPKRSAREVTIRNVVDCAHEVRVELHDSQVIFGSVMPVAGGDAAAFRIRPWGLSAPMAIRIDDVLRAAPIRRMAWDKQRSIAAAQLAGVFRTQPRAGARVPVLPLAGDLADAQTDISAPDATMSTREDVTSD
jgi:hypothetical protein